MHLIGGSIPICEPGFPKKNKIAIIRQKKRVYFRFEHLINHVIKVFFQVLDKNALFGGICVLDFQSPRTGARSGIDALQTLNHS